MDRLGDAGAWSLVAIFGYGALALTAGILISRPAPDWARRYSDSPKNSPEGWMGDRAPTARNFRPHAIWFVASGAIAFALGALLAADAVLP